MAKVHNGISPRKISAVGAASDFKNFIRAIIAHICSIPSCLVGIKFPSYISATSLIFISNPPVLHSP